MRNQARSAWNKAKEAAETRNETERRKQVVRYNAISMPDTRRAHLKSKNEEFDIYDIILSHLLDEGYAETSEAAESIMANMSEEWRQSIVEQNAIVTTGTSTNAAGEKIPWTHRVEPSGKRTVEDKFGKRELRGSKLKGV